MHIIYEDPVKKCALSFSLIDIYDNGNYYNIDICVHNGNYSGSYPFSLNKNTILHFMDFAQSKWCEESTLFIFEDSDSDSHISFKNMKYGHVICYGILGGECAINSLRFSFETDQTCYKNLVNFFLLITINR